MIALVFSTLFFVGIHLFVSGTGLRDRITDQIGEGPYMGLFSLASLGAIVWMCGSYAQAPMIVTWGDLGLPRMIAQIAMPLVFILGIVGLTTPSPTSAGGEKLLDGDDPARGILRVTRHPFLWAAATWATVHLLANGDAASLVFFGGLLILTLAGPHSIDAKRARKLGAKWEGFAKSTSNLPFAAIAGGRNKFVLGEIGLWRVAAGAAAWAAVWVYHDRIFG